MGCAESLDAQDPSSSQPLQSRRTVDIKPTTSHLVTKPEGASPVEYLSSGLKTQTAKTSAVTPVIKQQAKQQETDDSGLLADAKEAYNRSDYNTAINICQGILSKDSNNHKTHSFLSLVYYWNTEYAKGIESGLKAVRLYDKNDEYWINLGQNYYYAENYPQTIKAYQKATQLNPKSIDYLFKLGRAYYYNEQYKEAIATYKKGIDIQPSDFFYFEIGQCYYWLEDYDSSIPNLEKALKLNPKHHKSMNHLGLAFYYKQNYESAEYWYKKALEVSPGHKSYLWNLGRNYYWKEQYEQAIKTYELCKTVDKHYQYDLEIAWCYFYFVDYDSALEYIDKSIGLDPKQPAPYYKKGYVYYYKEQYKNSVKWYQKCLELDPNYYNALVGMANSYYYLEDYPSAINTYLKCLQFNKNSSQIYERIAKSYYYNQEYEKALQYFDTCMKTRPKYIEPLILKGRCYFNLEHFQSSYDQFKKAHALAESIKNENPQNYHFYIPTINNQLKAAEEFQIKAKIGIITQEDKKEVQQMRQNFEKKIEKLFSFELKETFDKKTAKQKPKINLNTDIIEIARNLFLDSELYHFSNEEVLNRICDKVKVMFAKDYGYFQIFAYIFQVFVWINKFKKKCSIQTIQAQLGKKIRYLSSKNPPTQSNTTADKSIQFPSYPEKKYNLFIKKHYFESYYSLVKQIQAVNEQAKKDLIPFKELLFKVQKLSNGHHAKAGMKLPVKQECKDQVQYQQKLFKVLLRIFEKMFKELKTKKEQMLEEIQKQINDNKAISIQKIILIMMNKWISYIDNVLKDRKNQDDPTECYITDLVRGKIMFTNTTDIRKAVDQVVQICSDNNYAIMELDNRLQKATQDVVIKVKVKHCVCELQLALQFDPTKFEFGHSFYEIERCSLGCIFGCSLFLTKEVNETFPELLFDNQKVTKKLKNVDKNVHPALEFVIKEFMESVKE